MNPPVESWQDILQPQAVDLALLALFVALVLVSFHRKSVRLKYAALVFAVAPSKVLVFGKGVFSHTSHRF